MAAYQQANREKLRAQKAAAYQRRKIAAGTGDKRGPKPKVRTLEEQEVLTSVKKTSKAAYDADYRAKHAEKIRARREAEYAADPAKAKEKATQWAEENHERRLEISKKYRDNNPEKLEAYTESTKEARSARGKEYHLKNAAANCNRAREWYAANPERVKANSLRYYEATRHARIIYTRARRMRVKLVTPVWTDQDAIARIYREARELNMHVDHIVPLQSKTVCGLHTEANLQLLTPLENMKKGNRYAH